MTSINLQKYTHLLLFGGTFDPPHCAHIELPKLAMQAVGAQAVVYIPAGRSPFKVGRAQTPAQHRLAMLQLALQDEPWALILKDEIEQALIQPDKPNYTVNTLEALRTQLGPRVKLQLLLGADQFQLFFKWHQSDRIEELTEPLVMVRPPANRDDLLKQLPVGRSTDLWSKRMLDLPVLDISATDIRQRLNHGQSVEEMLSPAVQAYIHQHKLYQ